MKRVFTGISTLVLLLTVAAPVAAADFPEQGNPRSCGVLLSLPKDVIGQIAAHAPATAARLAANLADACD